MMFKEVSYYREVVLKIPGGNNGTVFTWPDQPDIRNARTLAIRAYFANDLAFSQPAGIAVLPDAKAPLVTLTFETNDPDDLDYKRSGPPGNFTGTLNTIQWIPIVDFHVAQNFGTTPGAFNRNDLLWKDRYIIWQKSQVWIAPGGLQLSGDVAIVLGVFYSFLTKDGRPIPGARS